jgi:hypothetical protein
LAGLFPSVPGGTSVQIWNGSGFDFYSFSAGHWKQGTLNSDAVVVPPGKAFFIKPTGTAAITNTFVGSVVAASGATVTNVIPAGIQGVSSLIPYSGAVTNPAINLVVPGGTTLQTWNVANQSFDFYSFSAGKWKQGTTVTTPSINVGEGFFLNTAGGLNWTQTLSAQ